MSYSNLTSEERYVISHLVLYGLSLREIGRRLNRHHTTISREIKRNRPTYAEEYRGHPIIPLSNKNSKILIKNNINQL
jgi:IS30 family transposase